MHGIMKSRCFFVTYRSFYYSPTGLYLGYILENDNQTCTDLNECITYGSCHQKCENLKGSYKCSCVDGYILEPDGKTCKTAGETDLPLVPHRSRLPEVFCKKGVLKNFAKFTGKQLRHSLFFNKVAGLRPATLLRKRLWHSCFPLNFAKFLRTPFLQNTSGGCFLTVK